MRITTRTPIGWIVPVLSLFLVAGCGSGEQAGGDMGGEEMAETEPAVDPAIAATVTGTVNFEGTAPEPSMIDMSEEATCAEKHMDGPYTQEVVLNDNGTLRNVFVYVKEGLGDRSFPTPNENAVVDQDGCIYHPHVLGLQTGQTLTLRNSDGILHNINASPEQNRGFNISQPVDMDSERTFAVPEVMIPVRCDVHGWMQAYIGVVEHPYHAVSGDDGGFELANLPPGDYVVEAWHERYGVQTTNVSVGESETASIEFTFNASMAENAVVPLADPIDLHDHDHAAARPAVDG